MPFPSMPTQIRCPHCDTPFIMEVRSIVDIGEQPELKEQLLRGQLNVAECPSCHSAVALSAPLLYHDPEKELLVSFIPAEMGLTADQQEQYIGSLVKTVMDSLPPEERKGYFLQPKAALTMASLIDTILEADGVSREELDQHRARVRLLQTLYDALDDEKTFGELVQEHKSELTYEFFVMLTSLIDAADEQTEDDDNRLAVLREKLLERVQPTMPQMASEAESPDELIRMLQDANEESFSALVAINRPKLDYAFFQALTSRLEAAEGAGDAEEVERLSSLRQRILDEIDAQNRMVQDAEDQAGLLMMQMLEVDADNLREALREHKDEIDGVFISVLSRYQQAAARRNDTARAGKLEAILHAALGVMEEGLPPEARLVNQLARASYPEETSTLLEESRGLLSDEFLQSLDRLIEGLAESDRDAEVASHLRQVREQAAAKMTVLRA